MNKRLKELLDKKFIATEELEEIESFDDVFSTSNGMSGSHYGYHWYTVYFTNNNRDDDLFNEEFDVYVVDVEGKTWSDVKDILDQYITLDKDNIDKNTGDCIVDFVAPFNNFSVGGKYCDDEIIIADDELIYINC